MAPKEQHVLYEIITRYIKNIPQAGLAHRRTGDSVPWQSKLAADSTTGAV